MNSIGVYYVHTDQNNLLKASVNYIKGFVDVIHIVDSQSKKLPSFRDKKIHVWNEDFGKGFDVPIEKGGFRQVEARNFGIQQLYEAGVDYLVQCDCDEIFTPEFFRFLRYTPKERVFSLFEYCIANTTEYYLIQPFFHIRAWHKSCQVREIINTNKGYVARLSNKQRHSVRKVFSGLKERTKDLYHLHFVTYLDNLISPLANPPKTRKLPHPIEIPGGFNNAKTIKSQAQYTSSIR